MKVKVFYLNDRVKHGYTGEVGIVIAVAPTEVLVKYLSGGTAWQFPEELDKL